MRVEITEVKLSDTDPVTERHYSQVQGDVITVPDDLGARWCSYGWARDTSGAVPTGERIPGAREPLVVHDGHIKGN